MSVNLDKPHLWKADVARSVDYYNTWFMEYAPDAYKQTRIITTREVTEVFSLTENLRSITVEVLREHPSTLQTLRMATAPPIARDRLIGLAAVSRNLVQSMEEAKRLPLRMSTETSKQQLQSVVKVLRKLLDTDIFQWLDDSHEPTEQELYRSATVIADRLCGAVADPLIRNEQEKRQLRAIARWLHDRGYTEGTRVNFKEMAPGSFSFRLNVDATQEGGRTVRIPVDAVVVPHRSKLGSLPLLIEAKSAGDFTNTNKRRKEEATKISQLRRTYGEEIQFILFLCGYFDCGYLGYEAGEGIDWVWEHRIDDLDEFGL